MTSTCATSRVSAWLINFEAALASADVGAAADLFAPQSWWRDLVAFTWNIKTLEGPAEIAAMLRARLADTAPARWRLKGEASETGGIDDGWFTFETAAGRGTGRIRLKAGKAWILLTALRELRGFEEKQGETRELGTEHGIVPGRLSWLERRQAEEAELGQSVQPYCLIVGGGQGGLGLGARLKRIGVPTLIVDQHKRIGDSWRRRYKSLCLHDPVWFDHLPYIPFPEHWPVFTPKDKIGDWLEMYARIMELTCWSGTQCRAARWDEARREWVVTVDRAGTKVTLRPKHLVLATGMSGVPEMPRFPGADRFRGVQHHSSQHPGGDAFAGKKCVIIGANNSAHDIGADLWEHGADVTMVQRSSTLVLRSETFVSMGLGALYSEAAIKAGITTDHADLTVASTPFRLLTDVQIPLWEKIKEKDKVFYDRLRAVGFLLDFGDDDSGLSLKYMRRGSGYYIDVGASDLIIERKIKLKSAVTVAEIKEHSVVLTDGSELPADLIVYATGYGSMNGWAAKLISQDVADTVGRCWGLGSDTTKDPGPWQGELRNMWKPTRQENLWFHGGNLAQSRHYSLYMALQLKARLEGIATPVYAMDEVHHLS